MAIRREQQGRTEFQYRTALTVQMSNGSRLYRFSPYGADFYGRGVDSADVRDFVRSQRATIEIEASAYGLQVVSMSADVELKSVTRTLEIATTVRTTHHSEYSGDFK